MAKKNDPVCRKQLTTDKEVLNLMKSQALPDKGVKKKKKKKKTLSI